jgi:hypothetical protein
LFCKKKKVGEKEQKKRHGKSGRSHARRSKPGTVNRDINPANILLPIQKWGEKKVPHFKPN